MIQPAPIVGSIAFDLFGDDIIHLLIEFKLPRMLPAKFIFGFLFGKPEHHQFILINAGHQLMFYHFPQAFLLIMQVSKSHQQRSNQR